MADSKTNKSKKTAPAETSADSQSKLKTLWELFSVLFKIGICTFGGGIAMLPILERELADKRKWTNSEELLDWFAIGQSTPGIIAVNVATFIGNKRAGIIGGVVGVAGMVCPSVIIITIIAKFISSFSSIGWVQCALTGINVSVAALLTNAVFNFAKKAVKTAFAFCLFIASFVAIYFLKVSTIWIIIASSFVGIFMGAFKNEYSKRKVFAAAGVVILCAAAFYGTKAINQNRASTKIAASTQISSAQSADFSSEHAEQKIPQSQSETAAPQPELARAAVETAQSSRAKVSLPFLFFIFAYVGLITIGGGLVAITVMQQVLVDNFALVPRELFFNMVAISESTPGPMGINMATYVGTELYGVGGGIITTCGEVLPSIICILIIAKFFSKFQEKPVVKNAFSTLRPAVTGIIAVAAAKIFVLSILRLPQSVSELAHAATWLNLVNLPHAAFYIAACFILFKTKIHPLVEVLAGAVFGVILMFF